MRAILYTSYEYYVAIKILINNNYYKYQNGADEKGLNIMYA